MSPLRAFMFSLTAGLTVLFAGQGVLSSMMPQPQPPLTTPLEHPERLTV